VYVLLTTPVPVGRSLTDEVSAPVRAAGMARTGAFVLMLP